jgi:hypothetical protein
MQVLDLDAFGPFSLDALHPLPTSADLPSAGAQGEEFG